MYSERSNATTTTHGKDTRDAIFVAALPPQTNICRMTKTRYRATMIAALRDAEPDGYGLLVQTNKTKRFAYRGV